MIPMKWNPSNKLLYEELGYTFTKWGDVFHVNAIHIPLNSDKKIRATCDGCGAIRTYRRINYRSLCRRCKPKDETRRRKISASLQLRYEDASLREEAGQRWRGWFAQPGNKDHLIGVNNPNYKHDMPEEERQAKRERRELGGTEQWRNDVYKRDDYTCGCCSQRGGRLQAHHLYNWRDFPEMRYDRSNGVTLCKPCHDEFHGIFGKRYNTPQQFLEFLYMKRNQVPLSQSIEALLYCV